MQPHEALRDAITDEAIAQLSQRELLAALQVLQDRAAAVTSALVGMQQQAPPQPPPSDDRGSSSSGGD